MFACSSQPGKGCKSCYASFSSRWGCSGSAPQLWGAVHFSNPAELLGGWVRLQTSKSTPVLGAEPNPSIPEGTAGSGGACSPSLTSAMFSLSGALLVIYPIALDAAGQTGVREMGSRSLWRSAGIGFNQALTWDCWFSSGKGTEQAFNF